MKSHKTSFLKTNRRFVLTCVLGYLPIILFGQLTTTIDTSRMTYNQISSTLKVYVFPAKGQSEAKQKKDEYECYQWSVKNSGIDPLNTAAVQAAPVETGPDGQVVGSAAKGAIVGAAIGAVTGDAGQGAAVGAIAGGAGGIRQKRVGQARAQEQAQANADQQNQAMANSFIKAFSACIEGKGYTIK
jgi:hypothetical protein